jgi:hypothetical protein
MGKLALLALCLLSVTIGGAQTQGKTPRKKPGASKPECARGAICFSGEVREGEEFRRNINADLDFVLLGGGGIGIAPRRPDDKTCGEEFAGVVTGPQRAHNDLELDGAYDWTAEQEVQTSPREFRFVTSCAEYRRASALLQTVLWPESGTKWEEAATQLNALPAGQGRVWITDSRVTHSHDTVVEGHGAIEWMRFSVELKLPR